MPYINKPQKRKPQNCINRKDAQAIYQSKIWKKLREAKRMMNPVCQVCELEGKTTLTEDIHHLIPFSTGKTEEERRALAFDFDNLISVCKHCHNRLHKTDLRGCQSIDAIIYKIFHKPR